MNSGAAQEHAGRCGDLITPEAAGLGRGPGPPGARLLPLPGGELGTPSVARFQGPSVLFLQELNANLSNLTSAFEKATAEKIKCQQEADATNSVISLANRCLTPS